MNPIHIVATCFFKSNFKIIFLCTSLQCGLLASGFLTTDLCAFNLSSIYATFRIIYKKVKQSNNTPMEAEGERRQLLLILDLLTRWGWVVSVTPLPLFTPGEITPGIHCTGGWVGPTAGQNAEATGKILYLCRGSNLDRPVVQSTARHYTDWAAPAPFE
jgi:hypothetical protein